MIEIWLGRPGRDGKGGQGPRIVKVCTMSLPEAGVLRTLPTVIGLKPPLGCLGRGLHPLVIAAASR